MATAKDYEATARAINLVFHAATSYKGADVRIGYDTALNRAVNALIDEFKRDNPRFDEFRFHEACFK